MKNLLFILALFSLRLVVAQTSSIPHLEEKDGKIQLIVHDKPFLVLSGELHNSTAGSAYAMRTTWLRMAEKNLNTVIAPVSWELIEPQEGVFNFSLVDSMVLGARKENLKLVILWFASWKNGKSTYAPDWVKNDSKRFPLMESKSGGTMNTLSAIGENTLKADARAYVELMKHIKKIDSKEHTVIMMQVQNEIGVLGSPRDYSESSNKAFEGHVPKELLSYLEENKSELYPALDKAWADNGYKQSGTWEEVFGVGLRYEGEEWKTNFSFFVEEIFMAWNFAKYVGEISQQGKKYYPLPMFANAWLKQPRAKDPGKYPSGGPLPHVIDIWRAAAPSIDFIAPDIYAVEEFDWVCEEFTRSGNPLFIPETTSDQEAAARAFYAFGEYNTIGYAPFGIDGGGLFNSADPNDKSFEVVYGSLINLVSIISKYRGTDKMTGIFISKGENGDQVEMGDFTISVRRFSSAGLFKMTGGRFGIKGEEDKSAVGAIIIQLQTNEFLVAANGGAMINISKSKTNLSENVGYAIVDELIYENGVIHRHCLNGDEVALGGPTIQPGEVKIFKIKMYGY